MKTTVSLVGMKWRGTEQIVASLKAGTELRLAPEPDNNHDPNAVQVWHDATLIAYVKGTQARPISQALQRGCTARATLKFSSDRWPMADVEISDPPLEVKPGRPVQ